MVPERILIVRLGHLGDVIHTLPAVTLLSQTWPDAKISWLIEPLSAPLIEGNPAIGEVIPFPLRAWRRNKRKPSSWREANTAIRGLRARRFDLAIVFQTLIKSAVLARISGAREVISFDTPNLREPLSRFFLHRQIPAHRTHVVDRGMALVRALTGAAQGPAPELWMPPGETPASLPPDGFILASPFAGWRSKEWPPERFAELADLAWSERRLSLVVDGPPRDLDALQQIADQAAPGAVRVSLSTIPELIALTRRASAVVGVDSGPVHLAAALNKPGVALFGPTDPAQHGPYGETFTVIRQPDTETTYRRGKHYSTAMRAISARQVWADLQKRLPSDFRPLQVVG